MNREDLKRERAAREAEARVFHGRRQFAGIVLRALLNSNRDMVNGSDEQLKRRLARISFDWADAMLAEEKARYGVGL